MQTIRELLKPQKEKVDETLALAEIGKNAKVVFHDLSNHLTALGMSVNNLEADLARNARQLKEYTERSKRARSNIEYVTTLLRSHIDPTASMAFCPEKEMTQIISVFSDRAARLSVAIEFRVDDDSKSNILLFGNRLVFVNAITNLISNALESFPAATKTKNRKNKNARKITVQLKSGIKKILICVRDTGRGIGAKNRRSIFKPHFTTKPTGHGLGLSSTKINLAREFSAALRIKSSTRGSQFSIEIPKKTF